MARADGWLVRRNSDGTHDVFLNRRPCVYDRADQEEAVRYIQRRREYRRGQPVAIEQPDGSREVIVPR